MTREDERTPGTTADDTPNDAEELDAAASADAAGGSDSDDASQEDEDEASRQRRVNAQLQSENANKRKQIEELKQQLAARGAEPDKPTTDSSQVQDYRSTLDRESKAAYDRDQRLLAELENPSIQPTRDHFDAQVRMTRALTAHARQVEAERQFQRELKKVPGTVRDRVEELVMSGEVTTVKAAQRIAEVEAERDVLKKGNGKPPKGDDDDDGTEAKILRRESEPDLTRRAVTRGEVQARTVTEDKYRSDLARLREAGDMEGASKLINQRATGRLVIKR